MVSKTLGLSAVAALAFFLLGAGFARAQTPATTPARPTVLSAKRLCCAKESGPAISELSKVPGVQKVIADHKAHTLTIVPKGTTAPSPRAIWEAAERARIEPLRLATSQRAYTKKPQQ